ncbi:PfkB family carbohydrate kinase [Sphingomonas sp. GB1N7]|uniref:PfkB family carbohydrate kinase n=1 Tax=Parasphingomonas caseinilytica TaxID=3096158 RepID=UPI002FC6556D
MSHSNVLTTGFVALDVVCQNGADQVRFAAGGSCGNVSATLAALGCDVSLVSRLGDDAEASFVLSDLDDAGVCLTHVRRDPSIATPVVVHEVMPGDADHRFLLNDPASGARFPRYCPLEDADILALLASAPPRLFYFDRLSSPIIAVAKWAKAGGALTFFEPSDLSCDVEIAEVEPYVDILKISSQRAHEFVGRLLYSSPIQILTDGRRGLEVRMGGHEDSEHHHLDAVRAPLLVDSAGAGDAVSSGVIATILENWTGELPTPDLILFGLRLGQSLAALNCGFAGARGALGNLGSASVIKYLQGTDLAMSQPWSSEPIGGIDRLRAHLASHGLERRYAGLRTG